MIALLAMIDPHVDCNTTLAGKQNGFACEPVSNDLA